MVEYRSLLILGHPDAILNSWAVNGWRVMAVNQGGFDQEAKFHALAISILLERERPAIPPDPPQPRKITKPLGRPPGRRGRPPKSATLATVQPAE